MIQIKVTGAPGVERVALGLVEWAHLVGDFRPAFGDIRHVFNRHQARHFETRGKSTGAEWPSNFEPTVPWLPADFKPRFYPSWKRAAVGHTRPLEFSGLLRSAATGGKGSLSRTTSTSMEMGVDSSAVPYAENHHFGRKAFSRLFGRVVSLKERPVVRFNRSPLGSKGSAFDKKGRATFGYATRQLVQAHIIRARRLSLGFSPSAADRTIARLRETDTR